MTLLHIATILCLGLLVGVELAVSVFVNPILWQLDRSAQATATRLFAERLGRAMPYWYAASLLLLLGNSILRWGRPGEPLLITSTILWLTVIILTVTVLVPINNRMTKLYPANFSESDRQDHHRWDTLHRVRIAAIALCLLLLLIALPV